MSKSQKISTQTPLTAEDSFREEVLSAYRSFAKDIHYNTSKTPFDDHHSVNGFVSVGLWTLDFLSSPGKFRRGIAAIGGLGTGKTLAMLTLARTINHFIPRYIVHVFPAHRLSSLFMKGGIEGIDKICGYQHIVLDDIGASPVVSHYGTSLNLHEYIIAERNHINTAEPKEYPLITHITTNTGSVSEAIGKRAASRLAAMTEIVAFNGTTDKRLPE